MYYFQSRAAAGQQLAQQMLSTFKGIECAVVALSEGGVIVGKEIAMALECSLNLLLVDPIEVPGEPEAIGAISETGTFAYNKMYAPGQIEELMMDYRGYVEEAKRTQLSKLHQLAGPGASIRTDDLQHKHLILVSDGMGTGYSMDIALDVFKPVAMLSLSVAAPVVSPAAIDHMRVQCDHVFYLHVAQNYLSTDHYYDTKDGMEREEIITIVKQFQAQAQALSETAATTTATPAAAPTAQPVAPAPTGHSILDQPASGSVASVRR